jgi:hypothetical protein
VTLFADGRVRFEGLAWVKVKGVSNGHIDPISLEPLFEKIRAMDYRNFCNSAHQEVLPNGNVVIKDRVFDAPVSTVTIIGPGGKKSIDTVLDFAKPVDELDALIDSVSGDAQWIGPRGERRR